MCGGLLPCVYFRQKGKQFHVHLDSDVRNLLDNLAVSAQSFRKGANRVRKKMWWQNAKVRFYLSSSRRK